MDYFSYHSRPVASHDEMAAFLNEHPEWRQAGFGSPQFTRTISGNVDGGDVFALNDSDTFSHFIRKGDEVITAWEATETSSKAAFYDFPDKGRKTRMLDHEAMPVPGHKTDYLWNPVSKRRHGINVAKFWPAFKYR